MKKGGKKEVDPVEHIREFLKDPTWIQTLEPEILYSRLQDDHDGTFSGVLEVYIDNWGDIYISIDNGRPLRFRTDGGGGMSQKTRAALMVLAEAIRIDNEERPIEIPKRHD